MVLQERIKNPIKSTEEAGKVSLKCWEGIYGAAAKLRMIWGWKIPTWTDPIGDVSLFQVDPCVLHMLCQLFIYSVFRVTFFLIKDLDNEIFEKFICCLSDTFLVVFSLHQMLTRTGIFFLIFLSRVFWSISVTELWCAGASRVITHLCFSGNWTWNIFFFLLLALTSQTWNPQIQ